jgi:hypothetical protein
VSEGAELGQGDREGTGDGGNRTGGVGAGYREDSCLLRGSSLDTHRLLLHDVVLWQHGGDTSESAVMVSAWEEVLQRRLDRIW